MKKIIILISTFIFCLSAIYFIYFTFSTVETVVPKFPEKYDKIVVIHGENQWIIKRNKKVDEFIRKSNRVSEHLGEGPDFYKLKFLSNDEEVYYILYDNIGYPYRAIKVMNEIVKENGISELVTQP